MRNLAAYRTEARALLGIGLPMVGGHLAQFSMHMTDTVMLGWYSVEALAAVVLGATSFMTLFLVGSGFAWAVMPLVAAAAARGEDAELRRVTRMGLWLSIFYGVAVMPVFWFAAPVLRTLGQEADLAVAAQGYLRIAGWGIFPALGVMVLKCHLAAQERTQFALWATVVAAGVNAFLNWVLIFGNLGLPELGLVGAAIATVTTQVFSLVVLALYATLLPGLRHQTLLARFWRPDPAALRTVFRLGWPIGLTTLAEVGLFAASALMMGWIGTQELAAHGIAIELASTVFMIPVGLANAATVRAGRAHGAGDPAALRRVAVVGYACVFAFAACFIVIFLTLPTPLIGIFLDPADPERPAILEIGTRLLAVAALFQLADGGQAMSLGLLRGVQDTRVPMIYAGVSYWAVGLPASYLLAFALGLGGVGIWYGLVLGLVLAFAFLGVRFWRRLRPLSTTVRPFSAQEPS